MKTHDVVKVRTFVAVAADVAWDIFTTEVDLWWRRGPAYRGSSDGKMRFSGTVGGALIEESPGEASFVLGRVLAWEPPARLLLEWRARNFVNDEQTRVEVRFEPVRGGTEVTIVHSGWAAIREDHPVRHGKSPDAFIAMIGMWWAEIATGLRRRADSISP